MPLFMPQEHSEAHIEGSKGAIHIKIVHEAYM
jgi:hypothetical protein